MSTLPNIVLPPGGVLVASPSTSVRERVIHGFVGTARPVQEAMGGADALKKPETGDWQVLLLDRSLPDLDAEELIEIIPRRFPGIQAVLLEPDAGRAQPPTDDIPLRLRSAAVQFPPGLGAFSPKGEVFPPGCAVEAMEPVESLPGVLGSSDAMVQVCRLARLVAPRNTTVLITGPTGTGKELVARAIHQLSPRAGRPFVVVNCAAIPEALLESELFGHARGAFTGAVQSHCGRIQAAQGGTLLLDEVGELPLALQPKLLRFLEQKEIQRLGSSETFRVDVRVLAATNADLRDLVQERKFGQDLY